MPEDAPVKDSDWRLNQSAGVEFLIWNSLAFHYVHLISGDFKLLIRGNRKECVQTLGVRLFSAVLMLYLRSSSSPNNVRPKAHTDCTVCRLPSQTFLSSAHLKFDFQRLHLLLANLEHIDCAAEA